MQTADYNNRRLIEAAKAIAGEGLGFDPASHTATRPKANLARYVEALATRAAAIDPQYDQRSILEAALERRYTTDMRTIGRDAARDLADSMGEPMKRDARRRDDDADPKPDPKPAPAPADPLAGLAEYIRSVAAGAVDESRVIDLIREHAAAPTYKRIELPSGEVRDIEAHTHPAFDRVLALVAAGVNVMLTGPAGCGKTHLAAQVADALGRPFGSTSYTAGASETWLLGRMLPTGDAGRFEYHPAPFVTLYQKPSVFLHDELDAADPNMLIIANSALANGGFTNPMTGDHLERHAEAGQIAAVNTMGDGADATYTGREALDGATLDRWFKVAMDYDADYEKALAGEHTSLLAFVQNTRKAARKAGLNRVVSTRWIEQGVRALDAGVPLDDVKASLLLAWSDDERGALR